ncbi:site-2 protease family protein [Candidatus Sumerlaeota bacterium]|nr:site-2 protease family protein [Candidatus Sumerlaeota bacterium]
MEIDPQRIAYAAIAYPVLLFSLCLHEWGHAMSAKLFGDPTAEAQGRLTMNPLSHMDPIGTVLFPLIMLLNPMGTGVYLFGWARPVPVNPVHMRRLKDIVWVSLAGPGSNLALAVGCAVAYKVYLMTGGVFDPAAMWTSSDDVVQNLLAIGISINLLLMWFNLLPITPLDGSKVLLANIPGHSRTMPFWQTYEQYGPFILLILLFTGGLFKILEYPLIWSHWAVLSILIH